MGFNFQDSDEWGIRQNRVNDHTYFKVDKGAKHCHSQWMIQTWLLSILTLGDFMYKFMQFSQQHFSKLICHCLLPRPEEKWLAQIQPAGFSKRIGSYYEPHSLHLLQIALSYWSILIYVLGFITTEMALTTTLILTTKQLPMTVYFLCEIKKGHACLLIGVSIMLDINLLGFFHQEDIQQCCSEELHFLIFIIFTWFSQ